MTHHHESSPEEADTLSESEYEALCQALFDRAQEELTAQQHEALELGTKILVHALQGVSTSARKAFCTPNKLQALAAIIQSSLENYVAERAAFRQDKDRVSAAMGALAIAEDPKNHIQTEPKHYTQLQKHFSPQ